MTLLGLDFDNTIVQYDMLFYRIAIDRGLIRKSLPANKNVIRDYLRKNMMEDEFTRMQGEVYGPMSTYAEPSDGMLKTLKELKAAGIKLCIISHKTRFPYMGEKYDLHLAALKWLEKHGFLDTIGLGMQRSDIYFEKTKYDKAKRVEHTGCDYYIDDLPEVLSLIEGKTKKLLYDPKDREDVSGNTGITKITEWGEALEIILGQQK